MRHNMSNSNCQRWLFNYGTHFSFIKIPILFSPNERLKTHHRIIRRVLEVLGVHWTCSSLLSRISQMGRQTSLNLTIFHEYLFLAAFEWSLFKSGTLFQSGRGENKDKEWRKITVFKTVFWFVWVGCAGKGPVTFFSKEKSKSPGH